MSNGRKVIIAIACVAALCLVGLGAFLGIRSYNSKVYAEKINSGNRYYNAGDYANAVLAYQNAIKLNANGTEAYAGLARSYSAQGFDLLALEALQNGVSETGNIQLRVMLTGMENQDADKAGTVRTNLNISLMQRIASMSYRDYAQVYAIETVSGTNNSVTVHVPEMGADLVFRNSALQPTAVRNGTVSPDAVPEEIHLDDIGLLFGGQMPVSFDDLQQLNLEELTLTPPSTGEGYYLVSFIDEGCEVRVASDESGEIAAGAWNSIVPVNAIESAGGDDESDEEVEGIPCTGRIVSAVDGSSVDGVRMQFYPTDGSELVCDTVTDAIGNYTASLPAGQYKVILSRDGYIEEEQDLYIGAYSEQVFQDYSISPEIAMGEVRIVLSWGSTPRDLDSYLYGTADNGSDMYVSFTNKNCSGSDGPMASLDIDQTNGYGPETTTVYNPNGVYYFRVVDFNQTGFIGQSGATVTVYLPGQTPRVFQVSDGIMHENAWDVFVLDHGEIKPAEDLSDYVNMIYSNK